jgi:hypothetical protein
VVRDVLGGNVVIVEVVVVDEMKKYKNTKT